MQIGAKSAFDAFWEIRYKWVNLVPAQWLLFRRTLAWRKATEALPNVVFGPKWGVFRQPTVSFSVPWSKERATLSFDRLSRFAHGADWPCQMISKTARFNDQVLIGGTPYRSDAAVRKLDTGFSDVKMLVGSLAYPRFGYTYYQWIWDDELNALRSGSLTGEESLVAGIATHLAPIIRRVEQRKPPGSGNRESKDG